MAADVAGICDFATYDMVQLYLLQEKMAEDYQYWTKPTWSDILAAGRRISREITRVCSSGVKEQPWGRPVEWAIPQILKSWDIYRIVCPKPKVGPASTDDLTKAIRDNDDEPAKAGPKSNAAAKRAARNNKGNGSQGGTSDREKKAQSAADKAKNQAKQLLKELEKFKNGGGGAPPKPPKGEGKGGDRPNRKRQGAPKEGNLPPHLRPGDACDENGDAKCHFFQTDKCKDKKCKPGDKCSKGYVHKCTFPGCHGNHPWNQCPKK